MEDRYRPVLEALFELPVSRETVWLAFERVLSSPSVKMSSIVESTFPASCRPKAKGILKKLFSAIPEEGVSDCPTSRTVSLPYSGSVHVKAFVDAVNGGGSMPCMVGEVSRPFDRNDLYGTNSDAIQTLRSHGDPSIVVVTFGEKRYVTWCCSTLAAFETELRQRGSSMLNKRVRSDDTFSVAEVVPHAGPVDNIDCFLVFLEQMTELWDGRGNGFNEDTPHLLHRSVYLSFGDVQLMQAEHEFFKKRDKLSQLKVEFLDACESLHVEFVLLDVFKSELKERPPGVLRDAEFQGALDAVKVFYHRVLDTHIKLMRTSKLCGEARDTYVKRMSYLLGRYVRAATRDGDRGLRDRIDAAVESHCSEVFLLPSYVEEFKTFSMR